MSSKHVLLTGCSCGGKSTLLEALEKLGCATVSKPGRRIVADETPVGGKAWPWLDMKAFALRAFEMATSYLESAQKFGFIVFFDRVLIDAAVALEYSGGRLVTETLDKIHPDSVGVFVSPALEEAFCRRHRPQRWF